METTKERAEGIRPARSPVLDDGFVQLVDVTGGDSRIADAARLTSGSEGKDDRNLIRYLMRHRHDTPFEFAGFTIHIRIPMDAWRQFVRHRLFSINEYSTRYSEAIDSQQETPADQWRMQATNNRQGSAGLVQPGVEFAGDAVSYDTNGRLSGHGLSRRESALHALSREVYLERLASGVAREQARKDLPLSTYTEAWVECDLRGWLHFLSLRMDPHAQKEIRDYATVIGEKIVEPLFPIAWEAFRDYRLGAVTLTRLDIRMAEILSTWGSKADREKSFWRACCTETFVLAGWNAQKCRERDECRDKLVRIGLFPAT